MDLGTIAKKVKGKQYKTKQEFKEDLDLIWDNCLLYNTSTVRTFPPICLCVCLIWACACAYGWVCRFIRSDRTRF